MPAFVLMGSGEFLPWARDADRWALDVSSSASDRVLVAPCASAPEGRDVFDDWARLGVEHFTALGAKPEVLDVRTRDDAERAENARAIEGARYLFFSGGNPAHLVRTLRGTATWDAIRGAVAGGMALGGCSAGMVALGVIAPDTGRFQDAGPSGDGVWHDGLRFFSHAYFGAHWDQLDQFSPGLLNILLEAWPAGSVLFGLDENTAVCGDGRSWRVTGAGGLTLPGEDGLERVPAGGEVNVDLGLTLR